ncbi:phage holin family protein [Kocuria sediminis]|uniref:Membrane protein n=2 Tax=Kocuria TaxID=57493 RepID=A0A512ICB3_9MICC|nr:MULTISPECIES: phage holin family protein [Kocuria]MUN64034.1 phage holin family protein [Kocuria sediminis]GEO95267.1 membrane protein [Kocuria turfanensis]
MSFLLRVLVNALAIWVAAWILPGMQLTADPSVVSAVGGETTASVLAYLFVGLVFGVVNAIVRPVLTILSLPITCLTLGLFAIVVNAAMLWLTSWLSSFTPLRLEIDEFFWTAVLATLIIGVVSLVMGWVVPERERR